MWSAARRLTDCAPRFQDGDVLEQRAHLEPVVLHDVVLADLAEAAERRHAADGGRQLLLGEGVEDDVDALALRPLQDDVLEGEVARVADVLLSQAERAELLHEVGALGLGAGGEDVALAPVLGALLEGDVEAGLADFSL